jgi:hypothetical protein
MSRLKPIIFQKLKENTHLKDSTIKSQISVIRRNYGFLTINAAAEVYAKDKGFTVMRHLDPIDREKLANLEMKKIEVSIKGKKRKPHSLTIIANYETTDVLLQKHIEEINKTYTHKCYTATFILCRKVLENLFLQIILKKYPLQTLNHRAKYVDIKRGGLLGFSSLIKNLNDSSKDFVIPTDKLVDRICQLSVCFKDDANDMTHSLYHIAKKSEIDEAKFQEILDLIRQLNASL